MADEREGRCLSLSFFACLMSRKQAIAAEATTRAKREGQLTLVIQPGGNGGVNGFSKDADADDMIGSLNYGGVTFTRVAK